MTYLVAQGNFPHVVPESVEVLDLVLSHRVPWNALFAKFPAPTFIGNTIGGVLLVGSITPR
jgi:formate/nitrite transporter FocA (FNT family)